MYWLGIIGFIAGPVIFVLIIRMGLKGKSLEENNRHPSSFTVYPDGIEMNALKINRDDIHRLIIRNAYEDPTIIIDTNSSSQRAALGRRLTRQQVGYEINIESGGKATLLAGGLDEVTANGLYTDVSRILALN